jgi:alpha-L-rhamnosidase
MWELWNGDTADAGMNSRNIVMLIGDLNIWLHEYLAGIRPDPEALGFKKIIIKPEVVGDLTWVKDSYDSVRGRISSEWRQSPGQFDLRVTLPANTTARVYLPAKDIKSITEGGKGLTGIAGVNSAKMEADQAVLEIGSGDYHFSSQVNSK